VLKIIHWLLNIFFKIPEKLRYLLVGGFNTVTGYCIFILLYILLENIFHYNLILFIQYLLIINISYINMKFFVFRTKGNYRKEYIKTFSTYIFTYFLNALFLFILQHIFNIYISQLISLLIITIIIYLMHKHINFKQV